MQLDSTILTEYKRITGMDIAGYFQQVNLFFSSDYNVIVNYYSGKSDYISSEPFEAFRKIKEKNKEVFTSFRHHARQFANLKWWLLVEHMEEIDNRLSTLAKINKWSRSSLTTVGYNPSFQKYYVIKQNQTLESIAENIEGSINPSDDWVEIALRNNLQEENYSAEGGVKIKLQFNRINRNYTITSVVDVISGKSIYGKDLSRKIQWVKESGSLNLKTLSPEATILQAVEILAGLKKGDNPEYPNHGLQTSLIAGTNRALFNFPVIIRQKTQDFSADDTLKGFTILSLGRDQDKMTMEFSVLSRLNEVVSDTVSL